MKDLSLATHKEQKDFFDSFDYVLSDIDGVLWLVLESIPGTQDAIKSFKRIGKKVAFVTNNSTRTLDSFRNSFKSKGFDVENDEIIYPSLAIASHLKKINISKEIFVLGTAPFKKCLEEQGFKIADSGPYRIDESLSDLEKCAAMDNENIGAVVADIDLNLNYLKLQRAATYLKKPEVVFITGISDLRVPVGLNSVVLGPGYFHQVLINMTGRTPITFAKPSPLLNDYIIETLKITDTSRVLFIGDSISDDMGFAANCGYKKLLVLSGLTKEDSITNWTFPKQYKPDYYVNSLQTVHDVILRIYQQ